MGEGDQTGKHHAHERPLESLVSGGALFVFIYVVAFPIGVYSATNQYSWGDHGLTFIGFIGLATPNFLLALILMFLAKKYFRCDCIAQCS